MIKVCPDCNSKFYDYFDPSTGFTQFVCMNCCYYMSNSPAYRSNSDNYKNLIRENPSVLHRLISTKTLQGEKQPQNGQNLKPIPL